MASVHSNPGSPNWTASVRIWIPMDDHPKGGFWRRARRSTGIPIREKKATAQAVADALESASKEAAKSARQDPAEFYERTVSRLMSIAGVQTPRHSTTWADWSAQWLAEHKAAPGTMVKYRGEVAKFTAFLGARAKAPLRTITHTDCADWYSSLLARGLSASGSRLALKIVKSVLERARLHGYVDRNPAALVKLDDATGAKRKPFTPAEIRSIFKQIDAHEDKDWRTACMFGLLFGLRMSDAINRDFSEIVTEDGQKILRFVPQKKKRKGVPVSLPLVGPLASLSGTGSITPHVADIGNPSKVFSRILKDAGIVVTIQHGKGDGNDIADKSFHSWRHTCNTLLSNTGTDVRLRQLISDHETATMNARYTHPEISAMATAINAVHAAAFK